MVELCITWNEITYISDALLKNCNRIQNKGFPSIKKLEKILVEKKGKKYEKS